MGVGVVVIVIMNITYKKTHNAQIGMIIHTLAKQ